MSSKHPERKTGRGKGWLRNPTIMVPIIAAIITGIAAISAAFIQSPAPKPKLAEPMKIDQTSYGSGSPAIGQVGGNVTILQQGRGEKP